MIGVFTFSIVFINASVAQPELAPGQSNRISDNSEDLITLNLQDVDIRVLINTVAEISKKNFVIDPRVKGKVSVISGEQLNSEQLYEVFLSILQVHNFAAIDSGSLIKVVPSNIVKQLPTPTKYSPVTKATDAQVTQVLKLTHSSVQELIPIIRPLIPPTSHFAAHVPTNTLVVTDNEANIKRVLEIIEKIDVPDQGSSVHVVYLQKASATELAGILNQMVPNLGNANPAQAGGAAAAQRLNIQAQPSINALIINASDTDFAILQSIIDQLDIDRPVEGNVHVVYLKHAKATDLVTVLNEVTNSATGAGQEGRPASSLNVQADETTNSLIINADATEFRTIQDVIAKLDIRRAQVFVETIIAEVTLDQAAELGVELASDGTLVNRANPNQVEGAFSTNTLFPGAGAAGLTYSLLDFGRFNLDVILSAIRTDVNSNVLSTPTILTLDNEPAEILIGEEVPFITGQFTNNTTGTATNTDAAGNTTTTATTNPFQTIERQDVGIKLNITPQINEGDTIQLEVMQEISDVTNAATSSGAADIITSNRSIQAVVQVEDGQVVVLGGLIEDDVEDSITRVPILGDLPVVGALFRRKTKSAVKRNLMVFLKPKIIRSPDELSKFSQRRYDDIRAKTQEGQPRTKYLIPDASPPVLKEYDKVINDGTVGAEEPKKKGTWFDFIKGGTKGEKSDDSTENDTTGSPGF